jgi:hypothetical protein
VSTTLTPHAKERSVCLKCGQFFKALSSVKHPAYNKDGPRVLFDEAHSNTHTAGGRYKPLTAT